MASISKFMQSGKEKKKTQEEKLSLAHEFIARYHTVKIHQWRGNLKRIFCVGRNTVATIDPSALFKLTNEWKYGAGFFDCLPKNGTTNDFTITVGTGKVETMTFSSPLRAEILTEVQKQRKKFASRDQSTVVISVRKFHWNESWEPGIIALAAHGAQQVDSADINKVLGCYEYYLIKEIGEMEDVPGGFYVKYGDLERLHVYQAERRDELLRKIPEMAQKYIGYMGIRRGEVPIKLSEYDLLRLGEQTDLNELMSTSEFTVSKVTQRHALPIKRMLCLTDNFLVERDPATYNVVTLRRLCDIFALVRCDDDSQLFDVEYKDNAVKRYSSTDRDSLLAALQDSVRRAGNMKCCIKMSNTNRGQRTGSLRGSVPESIESTLLRVMGDYDFKADREIITYPQLIKYFNNNVEYSGLEYAESRDGLFAENKEKLIQTAIMALLLHSSEAPTAEEAADQFYALRRLAASPTGFESFTRINGFPQKIGKSVVVALKMRHDAASQAAIDFLSALLFPMHDRYDIVQEQNNRRALMQSSPFLRNLVSLLRQHAQANTGALVVSALLDFFVFALCPPYSDTTDNQHFATLIEMLAEGAGPAMFRLYLHPCMALGIGSGMLMKTIVQECESQAQRLQRYALSEGTLLRQFYLALFGKNADQKELAIQLIGLWTVECPAAQELLKRMIPMPLLAFLQSKKTVPEEGKPKVVTRAHDKIRSATGIAASHWRIKMGTPTPLPQAPDQPPVVLRKQQDLVTVTLNWDFFFHQLQKDHLRPDVIWNHHTREELREKMEKELALLSQGTDTRRGQEVAWNHVEFEVLYECLKDEVQIGKHFLRLLLEDPDPQIHNPKEFFYDLYHRYLLVSDKALKAQCMHGMARLYETHADSIGVFNDLSFMVDMLKNSRSKLERDRLLQFLSNLLRVQGNVKLFIDCHGVPVLIDLLTLAHLHHDRAQLRTQTNVIEMNPDEKMGTEPEWFYQDETGAQQGPISLDSVGEMYQEGALKNTSRLWAQGLDSWKALEDVPQLKWSLVYPAQGILNPTELSCLVLDVLIRMCQFYPNRNEDNVVIRPVPRIKRMLCEPTVLPHVAQLFLTLDPGLVNRTARLMCELMEDNPSCAGRLYLTGMFFFCMMYMGSDIKPIVKLLHLTHNIQAFSSELGSSILSPMLPRAMVCFLQNHGIEKFSEVYLGEFDNPEAIWGCDMRQFLVQSISAHLMEFTPKLSSNTRAIYTFCPITPVVYKELENELFCNIYYLRHLCDVARFPDWPITDQVGLLKDTLREWKKELEKKGQPTGLTRQKALEELELEADSTPEAGKIRKAYFLLAAKFHPDKNPDGRERFEAVLKAYEFLANPNQPLDTPDPKRIDLLIRGQSILYRRFKDVLRPYKYAGYPMLLKHVEDEANDPQLFGLETPLLPSAAELCLHTVNTSPLNAEELLREGGLQLLRTGLERCIDVIGATSQDTDMPVLVAQRVIETFAVAANFEQCRDALQEMPLLVDMVCKSVTCKNAPRLAKAAISCCSSFASGEVLQDQLFKAGILWHLLGFVFGYDFTLDEADVEKSAESNVQEMKNLQAKAALFTICRLCGFIEPLKQHDGFSQTLAKLLTPYVVFRLRAECRKQLPEGEPTVLKLLNTNSETPYMLWNNGTRAELAEFLLRAQEKALRGELVEVDFTYSSHEKELLVGGVFVRLYNEQPHFEVQHPERFVTRLIEAVSREVESVEPLVESKSMSRIGGCMEAMRNILTAAPNALPSCLDHFKMLFSVLGLGTESVCQLAGEMLLQCSQNHDVVVRVSEDHVLTPLIVCLTRHRSCCTILFQLLFALSSATKAVSEMLEKGVYVITLYEFATTRIPEIREAASQLLGKLVTDKLHGPKIALRASKIVPPVFIDTMKENPATAAMMFDGSSENPELIWTPDMRDRCISTCDRLREEVVHALLANTDAVWRLPEDVGVATSVEEVQVGGVYLNLYVKQPGWELRNPRKFLTDLFDEFFMKTAENPMREELVELIAKSIVCLVDSQPVLADQVPQLGHIPKMFTLLAKLHPVSAHTTLQIIHQLALCRACVERSMCQCNCTGPLLDFMKQSEIDDDKLGQAVETIERMMVRNNSEMGCIVKRAIDCDIPKFLLTLLDTKASSSVRAVTVKALKAMSSGSSPHCQTVKDMLDAHPRWGSYQSQNHDLFLTKDSFAGYLTGPANKGVVLSLTAGSTGTSAAHSNAPPPIEDVASASTAAIGPPPIPKPSEDERKRQEELAQKKRAEEAAKKKAEEEAKAAAEAAAKKAEEEAAAAAAAVQADAEAKKAEEEAAAAAAAVQADTEAKKAEEAAQASAADAEAAADAKKKADDEAAAAAAAAAAEAEAKKADEAAAAAEAEAKKKADEAEAKKAEEAAQAAAAAEAKKKADDETAAAAAAEAEAEAKKKTDEAAAAVDAEAKAADAPQAAEAEAADAAPADSAQAEDRKRKEEKRRRKEAAAAAAAEAGEAPVEDQTTESENSPPEEDPEERRKRKEQRRKEKEARRQQQAEEAAAAEAAEAAAEPAVTAHPEQID